MSPLQMALDAIDSFAKIGDKTLIPSNSMGSLEAKAYMLGSNDAFKQIAEAAKYCQEKLSEDDGGEN